MGNIYGVTSTHGVPLSIIFDLYQRQDKQIDWEDYLIQGLEMGSNIRTLYSKILEVGQEFYRSEQLETFTKLLKLLVIRVVNQESRK